jgi:bile acid:Na+ symporter, BASS family
MKITTLAHWLHHHFFKLLIAVHLLGLFVPTLGQQMRAVSFGKLYWFDGSFLEMTLPVVMLSLLLFNAGIAIKASELLQLFKKPLMLGLGLLANLLIPLVFGWALSTIGIFWPNHGEIQNLLVGLALVGAMPIAGSSTAWSQNASGNVALSLGLVVLSTLLSPITTPWIFHAFGWITTGDYSTDLHEIAQAGVSAFLAFSVVLPSVLGITTRLCLKDVQVETIRPSLKVVNSINLLWLIYSNAAVALPKAFASPDWDFLALIIAVTVTLCVVAFGSGWVLSKLTKADPAERTALMFGLGMNNNGTGLVLSSLALADHPLVMLPIIFYNLAQQVMAGIVDKVFAEKDTDV